jgi:competence protein ComEA
MKTIRTLLICLCLSMLSFAAVAVPVNINTVDASTLAATIKGVGPKLAEAIVQYRAEHGPFQTVDELQKVKGVGAKTIEKNREKLSVDTTAEAEVR